MLCPLAHTNTHAHERASTKCYLCACIYILYILYCRCRVFYCQAVSTCCLFCGAWRSGCQLLWPLLCISYFPTVINIYKQHTFYYRQSVCLCNLFACDWILIFFAPLQCIHTYMHTCVHMFAYVFLWACKCTCAYKSVWIRQEGKKCACALAHSHNHKNVCRAAKLRPGHHIGWKKHSNCTLCFISFSQRKHILSRLLPSCIVCVVGMVVAACVFCCASIVMHTLATPV